MNRKSCALLVLALLCIASCKKQEQEPAGEVLRSSEDQSGTPTQLTQKGTAPDGEPAELTFVDLTAENLARFQQGLGTSEYPTEFSQEMSVLWRDTLKRLEGHELTDSERYQLIRECRKGLMCNLGFVALQQLAEEGTVIGWDRKRLEAEFGPPDRVNGDSVRYLFDDGYAIGGFELLFNNGLVSKIWKTG